MNKKLIFGLFFVMIFLQLIVPFSMIIKREDALRQGMEFRFKTAPVDPYDAFRGRYVALRLEAEKVNKPDKLNLKFGQKIYASISVDENGFAYFSQLSTQRPQRGSYIDAKVDHFLANDVYLALPIDRYYMEEKSAPEAERIYRQRNRENKVDTYVTVKVKDGFVVVDGLYIGRERIEEFIKGK